MKSKNLSTDYQSEINNNIFVKYKANNKKDMALTFDDYTRANGLYKEIIEAETTPSDYIKLVDDDINDFSEGKSNKVIRDYISVFRGILLSHIINDIDKDKNDIASEIRFFLKNKLNEFIQ